MTSNTNKWSLYSRWGTKIPYLHLECFCSADVGNGHVLASWKGYKHHSKSQCMKTLSFISWLFAFQVPFSAVVAMAITIWFRLTTSVDEPASTFCGRCYLGVSVLSDLKGRGLSCLWNVFCLPHSFWQPWWKKASEAVLLSVSLNKLQILWKWTKQEAHFGASVIISSIVQAGAKWDLNILIALHLGGNIILE